MYEHNYTVRESFGPIRLHCQNKLHHSQQFDSMLDESFSIQIRGVKVNMYP